MGALWLDDDEGGGGPAGVVGTCDFIDGDGDDGLDDDDASSIRTTSWGCHPTPLSRPLLLLVLSVLTARRRPGTEDARPITPMLLLLLMSVLLIRGPEVEDADVHRGPGRGDAARDGSGNCSGGGASVGGGGGGCRAGLGLFPRLLRLGLFPRLGIFPRLGESVRRGGGGGGGGAGEGGEFGSDASEPTTAAAAAAVVVVASGVCCCESLASSARAVASIRARARDRRSFQAAPAKLTAATAAAKFTSELSLSLLSLLLLLLLLLVLWLRLALRATCVA